MYKHLKTDSIYMVICEKTLHNRYEKNFEVLSERRESRYSTLIRDETGEAMWFGFNDSKIQKFN